METNLGYGFFADNDVMQNYVKFICQQIELITKTHCGTMVNKKDGFPMKGYYIPVKLSLKEMTVRSATFKMKTLGYEKEFDLYMSRHKSPDKILHELQDKINESTTQIVRENNMDQDKIYNDYHPLKGIFKKNII